jgi:hypothetical protein
MRKPPPNVLELPLIERAEIALKAAVEKVMQERAREGLPVYVLRDVKIIEILAEELKTRHQRNSKES